MSLLDSFRKLDEYDLPPDAEFVAGTLLNIQRFVLRADFDLRTATLDDILLVVNGGTMPHLKKR